jgi:hypothetical protein
MTTRPKTGGRKRGSIDREARKVLTDRMAGDLMTVYGRLGGVDWLLEFAKANPAEFIKSGISRLWPAPQKDDEPSGTYNQFNFNQNDAFEAARRVAFLLSSATHTDPSIVAEQDITPVVPEQPVKSNWHPAPEPGPLLRPEPIDNPAQAEWAASLPLSPQERADQKLIRETREVSIANYTGSSVEQGLGPAQRQRPAEPRTVNELHQRMRNRRELL